MYSRRFKPTLNFFNPLDSACTATAYLAGVKTNDGEIGVNAKATYANCLDGLDEANHVDSIAAWFQKANRSSGIVTTTRITHAVSNLLNTKFICRGVALIAIVVFGT